MTHDDSDTHAAQDDAALGAQRDGLLRCGNQEYREHDHVGPFARHKFLLNLVHKSEGELHPVAGSLLEFRTELSQHLLGSTTAEYADIRCGRLPGQRYEY